MDVRIKKFGSREFCFFKTEQNNKFELCTEIFNEFSSEEIKDELEQILNISDITPYHLQQEKIGPGIIDAYRKLRSEKSGTDGFNVSLLGYARSPFRDFDSYFGNVVGLDENGIQLTLKQYSSKFVSYEIVPGFYTIKDDSEIFNTMGDQEGTLQVECDDIIMKSKLISNRFGSSIGRDWIC